MDMFERTYNTHYDSDNCELVNDWRDEAMNAALHASAYADGNCADLVLRAIRQHRPDAAVLTK